MEVVGFVQGLFHSVVEYAVSFRLGQSVLRHLDRVLWTLEKSARWALPPPLDQDDHPQPELIRPLPWVFFLALLIVLRVIRESISLIHLVLGKPPLRSADVVQYLQGKRRYLRTLKYQGCRMMRARSVPVQTHQPWYTRAQSLFEFTMCFRRTHSYGNNNTTTLSNNDEVLIVKRNKRGRQEVSPVTSIDTNTMERLIERMMVDLQADSDDDTSFTLTNATSDQSEIAPDSDHEVSHNNSSRCQNNDSRQNDNLTVDNIENKENGKCGKGVTNHTRIVVESSRKENNSNKLSSSEETLRLLQSERGISSVKSQTNHKSRIVNGKSVRQDWK